MSMENYFKKDTKLESNANFQVTYTPVNLISIRKTEIRVEMQKVGRKQDRRKNIKIFYVKVIHQRIIEISTDGRSPRNFYKSKGKNGIRP